MIATTIEQSKKLLELGLNPMTSDMYWCKKGTLMNFSDEYELNIGIDPAVKHNLFSYRNCYTIPAWSLSALLELIPDSLDINEHFCLFSLSHYSAEYYDAETTEIIVANDKPLPPLEAAYNMVVWLFNKDILKQKSNDLKERYFLRRL